MSDQIQIPEKFAGLFEPYRFKVFYGGRDEAKSWSFAEVLLHLAVRKPLRIVCAREFQNSIDESVKFLLEKKIKADRLPLYVVAATPHHNFCLPHSFVSKGLVTRIGHIDMRPQTHDKPVLCSVVTAYWPGNFSRVFADRFTLRACLLNIWL